VGEGELVVADEYGIAPADGALDDGLAVVRVRIEVADEAADLEPLKALSDVGLVVVPADLAVRDEVQAGFDLLLDDFDGYLVLDLGQLLAADLAAVQAGGGGRGGAGWVSWGSCRRL